GRPHPGGDLSRPFPHDRPAARCARLRRHDRARDRPPALRRAAAVRERLPALAVRRRRHLAEGTVAGAAPEGHGGKSAGDVSVVGWVPTPHISTTTYSSSTVTGNVSATYGPSTRRAPGSTVTGKLRTRTVRGSTHDLPVRMSYSH